MRTKTPATYLLFLIFICFAAGVISVVMQQEQWLEGITVFSTPVRTSTSEAPEGAEPVVVDHGQITILILGVDHIADPEGRLLAAWLITFQPSNRSISALGLPLDLPIAEEQPSIADSFNLWEPPEYGADFIQQLSAFAPSPLHGFVALDEHGFATVLDYFGGIDLDDQRLTGPSVIGSLRLTYDNPQAALRLQARILESLRNRVDILGNTPELTPLTSLAPIHAYTSPSPPELATLAIPLLPLDPAQIYISTISNDS